MSEKYNGWTNRATWAVALWCDCEGIGAQDMRQFLEEQIDSLNPILRDIIMPEYHSINWQEIEQNQEKHIDVRTKGQA